MDSLWPYDRPERGVGYLLYLLNIKFVIYLSKLGISRRLFDPLTSRFPKQIVAVNYVHLNESAVAMNRCSTVPYSAAYTLYTIPYAFYTMHCVLEPLHCTCIV